MLRKEILAGVCVLVAILGSAVLRGQQLAATPPISSEAHEFPIALRQNVIAGATPVGTKVQAKLVVATLVDSVVIPRDAVLSGEVTESAAKSASEPSRLAIRMDSAQWKKGSTPIKAYLTGWYYPPEPIADQKLSYQPADAAQSPRNWNGAGTYPDANNPASQPFPGRDSNKDQGPETASPASNISKHRLLIKNVDASRHDDGAVTLTSTHANIKLDKITTYVLSGGGVPR